MEKELNSAEEELIHEFAARLANIEGIEDMFPPDESGDREPVNPLHPLVPSCQALALAAVYDLVQARVRRQRLMDKTGSFLETVQ